MSSRKTDTPSLHIPMTLEHPDLLPKRGTRDAAGIDLRAAHDFTLEPGERAVISTGVRLAIPVGYEGQVRPRSGLAVRHGLTVLNSPGTIDADYRGVIHVPLINHGAEPFTAERGDRIAQLVIAPVTFAELVQVETLDETERGEGGFGSTGND